MAQSGLTRHSFGIVEIGDTMHMGAVEDGFDILFDGTNTLNIDPANANDILRVGETTQADVQVDGTDDLVWDASVGSLALGGFIVPCSPNAIRELVSGPAALSITTHGSDVTTTGADAFTLADGTAVGQLKEIVLDVDGGDATLTPATFADGSTVTFADLGDTALLMWVGASGWRLIGGRGVVVA